jgi:hypothetical protein
VIKALLLLVEHQIVHVLAGRIFPFDIVGVVGWVEPVECSDPARRSLSGVGTECTLRGYFLYRIYPVYNKRDPPAASHSRASIQWNIFDAASRFFGRRRSGGILKASGVEC